ncbi:hypothetical protein [Phaffia rhodozyma]|uniref:Transmembrane protein n=1 Tax=Phaffia rhodozyma TaxID=264483 RepID=A0A0F7SPY5_PHARH|nr:hypothetical protein [Phaffia rhodozyma]
MSSKNTQPAQPQYNNAGGPSGLNQSPLVGESAPPPAYAPSPYFQGLPTFNAPELSTPFVAPTAHVATQRARARFFKALVVAFILWVFLGAVFGGSVFEDVSRDGSHRGSGRHPHVYSGSDTWDSTGTEVTLDHVAHTSPELTTFRETKVVPEVASVEEAKSD